MYSILSGFLNHVFVTVSPFLSQKIRRSTCISHKCMSSILLKQPLFHSWRQTLKQLRYSSSQKNYLSMCRLRIRYQTGDHNLHHTYRTDIHVCKILGRSLAQAVSRTAEDLSRTQEIVICGGQSGTRTGSRRIHRNSPLGMIATVLHLI